MLVEGEDGQGGDDDWKDGRDEREDRRDAEGRRCGDNWRDAESDMEDGNDDIADDPLAEGEDTEARKPNLLRTPAAPTRTEIDEHMAIGAPHCVSGHGISHQHRKDKEDDEPLGITVSLDYCSITAEEHGMRT